MNIVILAAGQGKRMVSNLPKVLHRLGGQPLLRHVLNVAKALSPEKICVVYGHGGATVPAAFPTAVDVIWVKQTPQLGTGHALLQALPYLDKTVPTLVLYGDVPLISLSSLMRLCEVLGSDLYSSLGLLTAVLPDPTGYGRIIRHAERITGIVEERDVTDTQRTVQEINTGILIAPTTALMEWLPRLSAHNAQGEYYLTDIVAIAVEQGMTVKSTQPDHLWEVQGVNSKIQLAELERILQGVRAHRLLERGVSLLDPARVDIRGRLVCGRDVSIDINCIFEGNVELADGVEIGAHCILRNAKVGAGTRIASFSCVDDSVIGSGCMIGPYARVRPGTLLTENVHVGNFVEIKNSTVLEGSKINHLTYLGDADVGRSVNIGAGTITCNYDGANKYRTVIGDNAFIGSDTQLVAPVTVGKGATIGAGTTLTTNAPPEQLTISRAKQTSFPSWKRPKKAENKLN